MNQKINPEKKKARNGDGSIFECFHKDGSKYWVVEMSLGKKANGQRRRTRRSCKTYKEAKQKLAELRTAQTSGHLVEVRNETVETFGLRWARVVKPVSVRATTASDYQDRLQRYVFPYLGTKRMVDLRAPDVVRWMNELKLDGRSTHTVNGARRMLYGMCKYATREGIISVNPVLATDAMKRQADEKTQVKPPWELDEAKHVLESAIESDPLDAFLHIMLTTGMRPGEALGLRWEDIDLENSELFITGTLKSARRITPSGVGIVQLERNEPKTKASRRTISTPSALKSALERQMMRQSMWKIREGGRWKDTGYVVTSLIGTPVSITNLRKKYKKLLSENDIRYIRLHDIRHSVVTMSLELGIPLDQISQVVGHSSLSITKDIYGRNIKGHTQNFANVLGSALDPLKADSEGTGLENLLDGPITPRKVVKSNGSSKKVKSRTYGKDS